MKKHNEFIAVHPDFKRILKVKASMEDKTMIESSKDLADEVERILRGRGLLENVEFEKKREKSKNKIFF